jgi:hypothetical protein
MDHMIAFLTVRASIACAGGTTVCVNAGRVLLALVIANDAANRLAGLHKIASDDKTGVLDFLLAAACHCLAPSMCLSRLHVCSIDLFNELVKMFFNEYSRIFQDAKKIYS